MDMLHSFSLFIYKRQLPWSHPHPQSVLPQTGTRFLSGWEVVDVFFVGPKGKIGSRRGRFCASGFFFSAEGQSLTDRE